MADTITKCQQGFESYRLFEAADSVRRFIVEDVCDVYVEFAKASLNSKDVDAQEKVKIINASANLTNCLLCVDNVDHRRLPSLYCNHA
jgi:valyl-tRNA synthetase